MLLVDDDDIEGEVAAVAAPVAEALKLSSAAIASCLAFDTARASDASVARCTFGSSAGLVPDLTAKLAAVMAAVANSDAWAAALAAACAAFGVALVPGIIAALVGWGFRESSSFDNGGGGGVKVSMWPKWFPSGACDPLPHMPSPPTGMSIAMEPHDRKIPAKSCRLTRDPSNDRTGDQSSITSRKLPVNNEFKI